MRCRQADVIATVSSPVSTTPAIIIIAGFVLTVDKLSLGVVVTGDKLSLGVVVTGDSCKKPEDENLA